MKINTKTVLLDLKGTPLKDGETEMQLGNVVSFLLAQLKSNNPWKSYKLAQEFAKDEVDISVEDITFIKEIISTSDMFTPIIIGQIIGILEAK